MSKKTRGEVTRQILENGEVISTPEQLQAIVEQKFECALIKGDAKSPWVLEVFC